MKPYNKVRQLLLVLLLASATGACATAGSSSATAMEGDQDPTKIGRWEPQTFLMNGRTIPVGNACSDPVVVADTLLRALEFVPHDTASSVTTDKRLGPPRQPAAQPNGVFARIAAITAAHAGPGDALRVTLTFEPKLPREKGKPAFRLKYAFDGTVAGRRGKLTDGSFLAGARTARIMSRGGPSSDIDLIDAYKPDIDYLLLGISSRCGTAVE